MSHAQPFVFIVGVLLITAIAAVWDLRSHRIPNKLTLPSLIAGLLYQAVFFGWSGLGDAGLAFAVAFGLFFILWLVGGGGGGDVKLMACLSVWFGLTMTMYVIVLSVVFVIVGTVAVMLVSFFRRGVYATKEKYVATSGTPGRKVVGKNGRRIMPFAVPVALATWTLMLVNALSILELAAGR